jgi:hypothetical protein
MSPMYAQGPSDRQVLEVSPDGTITRQCTLLNGLRAPAILLLAAAGPTCVFAGTLVLNMGESRATAGKAIALGD